VALPATLFYYMDLAEQILLGLGAVILYIAIFWLCGLKWFAVITMFDIGLCIGAWIWIKSHEYF
jgi:hypothetical protein